MLARIAEVIRRSQENWRHELDDQAILAACRDAHYSWRERKLNPILTVRLFLLQILWGNTACNHLRRCPVGPVVQFDFQRSGSRARRSLADEDELAKISSRRVRLSRKCTSGS